MSEKFFPELSVSELIPLQDLTAFLFKFFSSKTIVPIGTKLCKNNPCEVLYTDDTFVLMLKKDGHH
jgi:hypothetical protein